MPWGVRDRIRFMVYKANETMSDSNPNALLSADLVVVEPEVRISLSAPSHCAFKIPMGEQYGSAAGINWKAWGQWIIPSINLNGVTTYLGAQLVNKVTVDPKSGDLAIEGLGFMGYPKGIPWLEDYNPIAVDPAEVIQKIWAHTQSFDNANLGVSVQPSETGTQMLPGYSFDGSILSFDFFAMFIRAVDFNDCGDVITSIARDIPLDMIENVYKDGENLVKTLQLGYPYLGVVQENLNFVVGENVVAGELSEEREIAAVSDVIVRGWRPGKVYSSQLSNKYDADDMKDIEALEEAWNQAHPTPGPGEVFTHDTTPSRVRRVVMEEDAYLDSTERAAAWAKRKLTRRQIPHSFSKINIDPSHPNALLGTFWLGDSIYVEAPNYPWTGDIAEWHRVTAMTFKDDEPIMELELKVEGAFNFDPIEYDPNYEEQPTADVNLLSNGYFNTNRGGWYARQGQWFRVGNDGRTAPGCVRIDCDDGAEYLESHKMGVDPGATINLTAWMKHQEVNVTGSIDPPNNGFWIGVTEYYNGGEVNPLTWVAGDLFPSGTAGWTEIAGSHIVSSEGVNEITMTLCVTAIAGGIAFWDDVKVTVG